MILVIWEALRAYECIEADSVGHLQSHQPGPCFVLLNHWHLTFIQRARWTNTHSLAPCPSTDLDQMWRQSFGCPVDKDWIFYRFRAWAQGSQGSPFQEARESALSNQPQFAGLCSPAPPCSKVSSSSMAKDLLSAAPASTWLLIASSAAVEHGGEKRGRGKGSPPSLFILVASTNWLIWVLQEYMLWCLLCWFHQLLWEHVQNLPRHRLRRPTFWIQNFHDRAISRLSRAPGCKTRLANGQRLVGKHCMLRLCSSSSKSAARRCIRWSSIFARLHVILSKSQIRFGELFWAICRGKCSSAFLLCFVTEFHEVALKLLLHFLSASFQCHDSISWPSPRRTLGSPTPQLVHQYHNNASDTELLLDALDVVDDLLQHLVVIFQGCFSSQCVRQIHQEQNAPKDHQHPSRAHHGVTKKIHFLFLTATIVLAILSARNRLQPTSSAAPSSRQFCVSCSIVSLAWIWAVSRQKSHCADVIFTFHENNAYLVLCYSEFVFFVSFLHLPPYLHLPSFVLSFSSVFSWSHNVPF